ncbi:MAG TPA: paraquat-inducible protein A [Kofleriaceae bacterium]|nr:paraquat-inducible protein A [Kofleriaceae bacterium]
MMTRGAELGLSSCPTCELVVKVGDHTPNARRLCPRCASPIRIRTRRDRTYAIALLIAATALYFPANVLTIMHTEQFPEQRDDTILSGVVYLWQRGSWDLAILVFAASICVPILKILALAFLIVTSGRRSDWRPRFRTKLYHVLEVIGHWSMLDVFVVALLTAVVQLGRVARVAPGPAVLPFAGVVVLTMLASASFDPRAIWDFADPRGRRE